MKVKKLAIYQGTCLILFTIVQFAIVWHSRTIWALIVSNIVGVVISVAGSYLLMDWRKLRITFSKDEAKEIIRFGKWIFLSSLIFFFASNFDRLYFADAIGFALLGVYGISRSLADIFKELASRAGNMLIFPRISATEKRGAELREKIGRLHFLALAILSAGLSVAIVFADVFVLFVYDERYSAAAVFLPILLIGTWFATLAAIGNSIVMGLGKPANLALGDALKLAVILAFVPLALDTYGMIGALFAFVVSDGVRYLVVAWRLHREGTSLVLVEFGLTIGMLALAFVLREATYLAGLTQGVAGWLSSAALSAGGG